MNRAPATQIAENRNIDPCNPSEAIKRGRNFNVINEHNDSSVMQNDTPKSFKLCGITSPIIVYGSVVIPIVPRNIMIENETIGIQLNASIL